MLGCSQIKGVLPPRFAEGAAAVVARIEDGKWNTLEGDGDPAKPSFDGIRGAHLFGAVVDPQPVWRARRARAAQGARAHDTAGCQPVELVVLKLVVISGSHVPRTLAPMTPRLPTKCQGMFADARYHLSGISA